MFTITPIAKDDASSNPYPDMKNYSNVAVYATADGTGFKNDSF